MANKVRHLLFEDGRYYFFRKVPLDLRPHYQKTFIKKALGTADRADALEALPGVVHAYNEEFRRIRVGSAPRFVEDMPDAKIEETLRLAMQVRHEGAAFNDDGTVDSSDALKLVDTIQQRENVKFSARLAEKFRVRAYASARDVEMTELNHPRGRAPDIGVLLAAQAVKEAFGAHFYEAPLDPPKTLSDLIAAFNNDIRRQDIKEITKRGYDAAFAVLVDVLGKNHAVKRIKRDDIERVCNVLQYLPVYTRKTREFDNYSFSQIAELTKLRLDDDEYDKEIRLIDRKTLNRYFGNITTLFRWGMKRQMIDSTPADDLRFKRIGKSGKRGFMADELKKLFHSDFLVAGNNWILLVGLFQGMRGNEIAQLDTADVVESETGIPCLHLRFDHKSDGRKQNGNDDGKSLKNEYSERIIPIHRRLIELGFLAHVETRRSQNKLKLFDVRKYAGGSYYDSVRKDIAAILVSAEVHTRGETSFHSLRHSFVTALRNANVPQDIRQAIGGWSIDGSEEVNYGTYTPEVMKPWLDTVNFDILE